MNTLKFKLVFAILTIFSIIMIVSSCEKGDDLNNINDKNIVINFKKYLNNIKIKDLYRKDFTLMNSNNPYDYEGELHNNVLNKLDSAGLLRKNTNINDIMLFVQNNYGVKLKSTADRFINDIKKIMSGLLNKNGTYNEKFVKSLEISIREKDILNYYFVKLTQQKDYKVRVNLSKYAENFIITSTLNKEEKKRLLITFAIYRYSTYYWSTLYNDKANDYWPDLIDAVAIYAVTQCEISSEYEWMIQDGKDIYAFSGMLSAVAELTKYM